MTIKYNPKKYVICYFDLLGTKIKIREDITKELDSFWLTIHGINKNNAYELQDCIIKSFTDNFLLACELDGENPRDSIYSILKRVGYAIDISLI